MLINENIEEKARGDRDDQDEDTLGSKLIFAPPQPPAQAVASWKK